MSFLEQTRGCHAALLNGSFLCLFTLSAGCVPNDPIMVDSEADAGPSSAPDGAAALPDCRAQRVVHLVGGVGGLAWFTQAWPPPEVINNFQAGYAFDDPSLATDLTAGNQKLFVRRQTKFGAASPLWSENGSQGQPSAFVVGRNETHTGVPSSAITLDGQSVIALGAIAQEQRLPSPLPAIEIGRAGIFGSASGSPTAYSAENTSTAIDIVAAALGLSPAQANELQPDPAILSTWHSSTNQATIDLAVDLLFAANLINQELVGTIVIEAFGDDPHDAFGTDSVTPRADDLVNILEGFYRQLALGQESTCGRAGEALSMADNVMFVVNGDTPKNSFAADPGWNDGTIDAANFLYVRSNGFLKPGWFGEIAPTQKTNFGPSTGLPDLTATDAESLAAAINSTLFAIVRGDRDYVGNVDARPFGGVTTP